MTRGRDQRAAEGSLQAADRRWPRAAAAAADAARAGRLVLRPARAVRADGAQPACRVRRRFRSRGGRGRSAAPSRSPAATCSTSWLAGREVAGDARRARRRAALPHAGDDPRLREREAGAARRRRRDGGTALRALLRDGQGREQGPEGPAAGRLAVARSRPSSTTCARAIALSLAGGVDPFIAVKFAVAMQGFWILRGYSTEGRKLVHAALALPAVQASPIAQAYALYVGAALAESQSDSREARMMLETCLELRRGLGNESTSPPPCRRCRWPGCRPATPRRPPSARGGAADLSRASATASARPSGCCTSARSASTRATTRRRDRTWSSASAIAREIRIRRSRANASWCSASWRSTPADREQARLRFKRSLTVCREAGDKRGEANALWWLAGRAGDRRSRLGAHPPGRTRCALSVPSRCARSCSAASRTTPSWPRRRAGPKWRSGSPPRWRRARERLNLPRSPRGELRWHALVGKLRRTLTDAPVRERVGRGTRLAERRGHQGGLVDAGRARDRLIGRGASAASGEERLAGDPPRALPSAAAAPAGDEGDGAQPGEHQRVGLGLGHGVDGREHARRNILRSAADRAVTAERHAGGRRPDRLGVDQLRPGAVERVR